MDRTTNYDRPADVVQSQWLSRILTRAVVAVLAIQAVTGVLLMAYYTPATASAWGSTWYVQTKVPMGWLVRGVHHVASDVFIVLLIFHAANLLWRHGLRPLGPIVLAWPATLGCMLLAIALSLTGELLPWDEQGYWGTNVRTQILARTPLIGEWLRRALIGGEALGNLTLTRFHALHVILLPATLGLLLYMALKSQKAKTTRDVGTVGTPPVPLAHGSLITEKLAGFFAAGVILVVVVLQRANGEVWLEAPADPAQPDYPARPEWHTLFLFQWLKYFQSSTAETVAAIVVPMGVAVLLFALPQLGRLAPHWLARRLVRTAGGFFALSVVSLTALALWEDRRPPDGSIARILAKRAGGESLSASDEHKLRAARFHHQVQWGQKLARRSMELADQYGIPPSGPLELLRQDWKTQGPALFAAHCASCHRFDGHDGKGLVPIEPPASSDLARFATSEWIRGFLEDPMADRYFGRMKTPEGAPAHTKMREWLSELRAEMRTTEERQAFEHELDAAAAYLEFESRFPGQLALPPTDPISESPSGATSRPTGTIDPQIEIGRAVFTSRCNECHSYQGERFGTFRAPEMFGYGSVEWIEPMIAEPGHESRYRSKGRQPAQMPPFKDRLTPEQRRMIAQWLYNAQ